MQARILATFLLASGLFGATLTESRLMDAVKSDNLQAVKTALAQGANVNATEADGSTALHWAAQGNNDDMVAALLAAGAKADVKNRFNVSPLAVAAMNGNVKMIERLLNAGADAKGTSEEGQTILMTAALSGNPDAVKLLVQRGADVNAVEPYKNQTALMFAAGENNTKAVAQLIEFGANVKAKSKGGYTAFHFAVRNRSLDSAKYLLQHGADVNEAVPDGSTPLNMAIVNAYYDVASMLLDFNANPNAPDPRGSALHSLAWMRKPGAPWEAAGLAEDPEGPPKPSGNVTSMELAKKLLDKGANPNVRVQWKEGIFSKSLGTTKNPPGINLGRHYLSFDGTTPFFQAARNGDAPYMKLLLQYGADPKIASTLGVTPLMAAAGLDYYEGETPGPYNGVSEPERLEAVKLCVELGNDINAKTNFGEYALEGAPEFMLKTYPTNIDKLLNLGVGDPRWNGMTAMHGAVISNQPSILAYLIEKGGRLDVKNQAGWTPLMVSHGIFMANAFKEFPWAQKMITEALTKQGKKVE